MWLTISNSIHQAKPPTYFNDIEDIFIMHWPLFIKGFNQTLNWLELIFYATSYTWMKVYFLLFLSGSRFETLHGWNRFYFMFNRLHKGESLRKQSGLTLRFINGKLLATGVKKKNSNGGAILFSLLVLVSSKKKRKQKMDTFSAHRSRCGENFTLSCWEKMLESPCSLPISDRHSKLVSFKHDRDCSLTITNYFLF